MGRLLEAAMATCEVVLMEVLAGARDEHHLARHTALCTFSPARP